METKTMHFITRAMSFLDLRLLLALLSPLSLLVLLFFLLSAMVVDVPYFSTSHRANQSEPLSPAAELDKSRIAVCLVGGARIFELTGRSIVDRILEVYPNSDLFLNSPLDRDSYKLSLLNIAPRIAVVRIFEPKPIEETEMHRRVLTPVGSPNGIQGLLQYFNLVEGCISIIKNHETRNKFTYDWIIRTRVDGYWSAPLDPQVFVRGQYMVPSGSAYAGLNDRLGVGDWNTSIVALSRLSLLPTLDSVGFRDINSERAFKGQLTTHNVSYNTMPLPFCIVSDRKFPFPTPRYEQPVAGMSSLGPLSGAKCAPCTPACVGECVDRVLSGLEVGWNWDGSWNGTTLNLCKSDEAWEAGWERLFDRDAGKEMAESRRRIGGLNVEQCVRDFEEMKMKSSSSSAGYWDTPPVDEICKLGLSSS